MLKGIAVRLRRPTLLIVLLAIALGSASVALAGQANREAAPSDPPPTKAAPVTVTAGEPSNPYYSLEIITLSDGRQIGQSAINGPAEPPSGYELERAPLAPSTLNRAGVSASLAVPAYNWVFGCSAVSASMIGAYFDRNGLPNIYTGPTNGGVMPDNNGVWPKWTDSVGKEYPGNPLAASRNGSDGRTIPGSIDDYWIAYDSTAPDPYITGGWTQHTWGDAFGDYMKTSQSYYGNPDGQTYFNWWLNGAPLTCVQMESTGSPPLASSDGGYGRKLFYEARGYTVTDCYNRRTDNVVSGGFSFANYKAQIDAGYPVIINLMGHTVVGIGYADPSTVYINDTWDYNTHQMTWGGSYSGMLLDSVSVVNPVIPTTPKPAITGLNPSSATPGGPGFTLTVNGANFINDSVVRWNGSDRTTTYVNATRLTASITSTDIAVATTASVTVYNPGSGGGTSNPATFTVGAPGTIYLPLVLKGFPPVPLAPVLDAIDNADGDGNYTVSWSAPANATAYLLQEDDNAAFSSPETRYSGSGTSWNAAGQPSGTYHYRVQASNTWGGSGWSNVASVIVRPSGACTTTPLLTGPADGSRLDNLIPLLQWDSGNDPNATATLVEAARDPGFTQLVSSLWTSSAQGPYQYRFIRNFDPTTTYYWRAYLECGDDVYGPYSVVWSFTAGSGGTILPAPILVAPADGGAIPATSADLKWSSVSGAVEYRVHWRKAGTTGSTFRRLDDTQATVSGLSANTTYEWWSAARNDYAWSSESPHWTFTTGAGVSSSTSACPDPIVKESNGTTVVVEKDRTGVCRGR